MPKMLPFSHTYNVFHVFYFLIFTCFKITFSKQFFLFDKKKSKPLFTLKLQVSCYN